METKLYIISNISEMNDLGYEISKMIGDKKAILLKGDLGAGKTTLAKSIIFNLTSLNDVVSPTFNILKIYESANLKIFHYDLYRLKSEHELEEIGFYDNLEKGVSIIEWPELAGDFLDKSDIIDINIEISKNLSRSVTIKS